MAFLSLNVLWNTLYACEEECGMGRWWPALIGWRVVSYLRRATTTVVAWATLSVHFPRGSRREVVVLSSNSSSTTHQTEHYCTLILFVNDTYCAFVNTFGSTHPLQSSNKKIPLNCHQLVFLTWFALPMIVWQSTMASKPTFFFTSSAS